MTTFKKLSQLKLPATALQSALLMGAMWVAQAVCFMANRSVGEISSWLSIAGILLIAGIAGRRLPGMRLLAAVYGAALGWLYMHIEWKFLNVLLVRVLAIANEEEMQVESIGFSLLVWPVVALCGLCAALAASQRVRA